MNNRRYITHRDYPNLPVKTVEQQLLTVQYSKQEAGITIDLRGISNVVRLTYDFPRHADLFVIYRRTGGFPNFYSDDEEELGDRIVQAATPGYIMEQADIGCMYYYTAIATRGNPNTFLGWQSLIARCTFNYLYPGLDQIKTLKKVADLYTRAPRIDHPQSRGLLDFEEECAALLSERNAAIQRAEQRRLPEHERADLLTAVQREYERRLARLRDAYGGGIFSGSPEDHWSPRGET